MGGPLEGKTVVIADIIDLKRVIVSGPHSGVARQQIPIKWLSLTSQKCSLKRGACEKSLKKNMAKDQIIKKWEQTGWAKKKAAQAARANLTDFERFKLMICRKKAGHAARAVARKLTKKK